MEPYQPEVVLFEVGEYYGSENKQTYKLTEDQRNIKGVWRGDILIDDYLVVVIVVEDELQSDKLGTDEQIAIFKRAENFAAHWRK